MILLITSSVRAEECATALQAAVNEPTQVASGLQPAMTALRAQEFSAVVIDQLCLDAEPEQSETLLQHIGAAMPVQVNFAVSGIERTVRELRAAMSRRKREAMTARQGAEQALRNELKGTVTALLLSCELALQVPNLPKAAEVKLRTAFELAREVRLKIGMAQGEESGGVERRTH